MKQAFIDRTFQRSTLAIIDTANEIIEEYAEDNYTLTLRQLYYQFIALDRFPESWIDRAYNLKNGLEPDTKNTQKNYDRLGAIINDARLAGYIDWDSIEDRGRNLIKQPSWGSPANIINAAYQSYQIDLWASQPIYIEVWVEKLALESVIGRACDPYRVPYFACKGYNSQSEMYEAGKRMAKRLQAGKEVYVLHLGDHDPSGIDMTRDNQDRLLMFLSGYGECEVDRLALNFHQVQVHQPPPNPAKMTDSRFDGYAKIYGRESWELDALRPQLLVELIQSRIISLLDAVLWDYALQNERDQKELLKKAARNWSSVATFLTGKVKETPKMARWLCPDCGEENKSGSEETRATCEICSLVVTLEDIGMEGWLDAEIYDPADDEDYDEEE